MDKKYRFVWKTKDEVTQADKDAIHFLAMTFYPEGRAAYETNYWYSSIEPDALLLLFDNDKIISYSKYVVNKIFVDGKDVMLAGFSLLTHGDYQGKGIAGTMVEELQKSMGEKGTDILYATTIFPQVEHILEKRGFVRITNLVTFIHARTGEKTVETEAVFVFSHDTKLMREIQQEKEFFIGRGPM